MNNDSVAAKTQTMPVFFMIRLVLISFHSPTVISSKLQFIIIPLWPFSAICLVQIIFVVHYILLVFLNTSSVWNILHFDHFFHRIFSCLYCRILLRNYVNLSNSGTLDWSDSLPSLAEPPSNLSWAHLDHLSSSAPQPIFVALSNMLGAVKSLKWDEPMKSRYMALENWILHFVILWEICKSSNFYGALYLAAAAGWNLEAERSTTASGRLPSGDWKSLIGPSSMGSLLGQSMLRWVGPFITTGYLLHLLPNTKPKWSVQSHHW